MVAKSERRITARKPPRRRDLSGFEAWNLHPSSGALPQIDLALDPSDGSGDTVIDLSDSINHNAAGLERSEEGRRGDVHVVDVRLILADGREVL